MVVFDQQVWFTFDDEDAFATLRVEDVVVHDAGVAGLLAAKRNICLDVLLDLVCNDLGRGPLNDQDALIIVLGDHISIWETFDSKSCSGTDFVVGHHMQVVSLRCLDLRCFVHSVEVAVVVRADESSDRLLLGRHECVIVCRVLALHADSSRDELDVCLVRATDVRNGQLCQLDSSFAVLLDDVASDVRVALATLNDDSVVAARCDQILPDFGRAELRPVRASDLDAVLMTSLDFILDDVRLVVVDFDSDLVQVELVSDDLQMDNLMINLEVWLPASISHLHLLGHQDWWRWPHTCRS